MIAPKSTEPQSREQLPRSRKVFVTGKLHNDVRVPFREIELSPTVSHTGRVEVNESLRVYDTKKDGVVVANAGEKATPSMPCSSPAEYTFDRRSR